MDAFQAVVVVNRRNRPEEFQFDGRCIKFGPLEKKAYPPNVAYAIAIQSMLRVNLATGVTELYKLGVEGDPAFPCDPLTGALAEHNPVEILDRRDVPRLTETEPQALSASGTESLGVGKVEKTLPPLPGGEGLTESPFEGEGPVGGSNPEQVVQPASAEDVKPMTFKNPDVRKGSQRPGRAEHRVNVKQSQ